MYIIQSPDGKVIPEDLANKDYQKYLESLPKTEPTLTPLERAKFKRASREKLDSSLG